MLTLPPAQPSLLPPLDLGPRAPTPAAPVQPFEIPEIAELYLRLLSGYVKINLLVSKLDDRKLAVAAYSRVSPLLPRPNAGNDAILSRRYAVACARPPPRWGSSVDSS